MSRDIIKRIEKYKHESGKTYFQIASDLGVPEATLHRWRKNPMSMQRGYAELMDRKLKERSA